MVGIDLLSADSSVGIIWIQGTCIALKNFERYTVLFFPELKGKEELQWGIRLVFFLQKRKHKKIFPTRPTSCSAGRDNGQCIATLAGSSPPTLKSFVNVIQIF